MYGINLPAALMASAFAVWAAGADDTKKPGTFQLPGMYTFKSGERDGKAIPPDHLAGAMVRFTETEVIGTDKDQKHIFSAKYTLDTTPKPWTVKMTSESPKKVEASGLLEKRGDELWLIYNLPGGKPPTEFKTGENQQMFVLVQQTKETDANTGAAPKK
jgi:uncharacterized protein (TIGR03067 family)